MWTEQQQLNLIQFLSIVYYQPLCKLTIETKVLVFNNIYKPQFVYMLFYYFLCCFFYFNLKRLKINHEPNCSKDIHLKDKLKGIFLKLLVNFWKHANSFNFNTNTTTHGSLCQLTKSILMSLVSIFRRIRHIHHFLVAEICLIVYLLI